MKPKVALYISGGVLQGARSNIKDLDIEVIDEDNEPDEAEPRWEELQQELEFGIY
jgi:hypothetical protein